MIIKEPCATDLPALEKLWLSSFGDTQEFWQTFLSAGFSAKRCRCVFLENQPIAALYWFDCFLHGKKLAYLYGIATEKAYRGKGLSSKLIENTHKLLQAQGYFGTVLVPAAISLREFYRRFGYKDCGGMAEQTVCPSEKPVALQKLTKEVYQDQRRQKMPADGVELGVDMLNFLGEMAEFYAGSGFALAVSKEEDKLIIKELLGICPEIGGVAAALGNAAVTVRTSGNTPFAMYRPLTEEPTQPEYFGIALD